MDDLIEFYDQYGEGLARRLVCIGHTDTRLAYLKVADIGSPAEVLKAVASLKAETNVLIWEQFVEDINDGGRDNYTTQLSGSIAVIRSAGTSVATQRAAVKLCRAAVLKAVALMLNDAYGGVLAEQFISFRVNRQSGQSIANLATGWWGYGFEFSWTCPLDLTLSEADLVASPA